MIFLLYFVLGILLGFASWNVVDIIGKMHTASGKEYPHPILKRSLWVSVFGLAIIIIIAAALFTAQIGDSCYEKITALDERVTAIEKVVNEN